MHTTDSRLQEPPPRDGYQDHGRAAANLAVSYALHDGCCLHSDDWTACVVALFGPSGQVGRLFKAGQDVWW